MHQLQAIDKWLIYCIVFVCELFGTGLLSEWPQEVPRTVNLFVSMSYFRLLVKWSDPTQRLYSAADVKWVTLKILIDWLTEVTRRTVHNWSKLTQRLFSAADSKWVTLKKWLIDWLTEVTVHNKFRSKFGPQTAELAIGMWPWIILGKNPLDMLCYIISSVAVRIFGLLKGGQIYSEE